MNIEKVLKMIKKNGDIIPEKISNFIAYGPVGVCGACGACGYVNQDVKDEEKPLTRKLVLNKNKEK